MVSSLTVALSLAGGRALSMLMTKGTRNFYCLAMTEKLDTKRSNKKSESEDATKALDGVEEPQAYTQHPAINCRMHQKSVSDPSDVHQSGANDINLENQSSFRLTCSR